MARVKVVTWITGGVMEFHQATISIFSSEGDGVGGAATADLIEFDLFIIDSISDLEDYRASEPCIV